MCTRCALAIEDDARQIEIEPVLIRRCLGCGTDIAHLRAGARTTTALREETRIPWVT